MAPTWIRENPARWDAGKAAIVGGAERGTFDPRKLELHAGELVPGEWWRVEDRGEIVGYGWMDATWGDAEILLAVDARARRRGIGSFILGHLELEARARGLNYLCNVVRDDHPDREGVTQWLRGRGFVPSDDGRLLRAVVHPS